VAALNSMSRWDQTWVAVDTLRMPRGVTQGLVACAVRCAITSLASQPVTAHDKLKDGAMLGAFDWRAPRTEAPIAFEFVDGAESLRDNDSSRTIGAVTPPAKRVL